ncbi:MAG: polysaccharide biosynthesis tyrosine autokinase [Proteobacteria bacterium]|nr:polysaccharide biosynthesis tyrosine autokinase [Pseudomonadota bacterium]
MTETEIEEKEIHLRDYLRILDKRKYPIVIFFAITFTIVLIKSLTTTPLYTAEAKVLIEKADAGSLVMNYAFMPYDPEFKETQTQIIKSLTVARNVVDILNLSETFDLYMDNDKSGFSFLGSIQKRISGILTAIKNIFGLGKMAPLPGTEMVVDPEEAKKDMIANIIRNGINVNPVPESKIVHIGFTSQNPQLASMIVNTVAKAYMDRLLEMKMQSSAQTIKWMREKVDEEGKKLQESENKLQEYMKERDIVTIEDRVTIIPQKLAELSRQLTAAETKRKELETLYKNLIDVKEEEADSVPVISGSNIIQTLRTQINTVEQRVADLSQVFGEKYPDMIKARDELQTLKNKRQQEIERIKKSIKNEYEISADYENNIRALLDTTKDEAVKLNEKFIQYGMLRRDIESNRSIFDGLMKSLKEQTVTEQTQTANVWIVEKAVPPDVPSQPNTKRNILLGLVLGLFGGIGLAFFLEYLDNTVKSPGDVEARVGIPVLGSISLLKSVENPEPSNNGNRANVIINKKESSYVESYKSLRTAILLSSAEKPPKNILVTSAVPGEGKTTMASNLAIIIARTGKNVLLIDSDLRKPQLHQIFHLDNTTGLSTFLAGASDSQIIQKTPIDHLRIVPSGPIPPDPAELLSSSRMDSFINACKEKFDFIIFDSPPILSVSDSLLLSRLLDGTIVVSRFGKTSFDAVEKSMKSLNDLHVNVLGMVINGVDVDKSSYYYNYAYQYDHYYKSNND